MQILENTSFAKRLCGRPIQDRMKGGYGNLPRESTANADAFVGRISSSAEEEEEGGEVGLAPTAAVSTVDVDVSSSNSISVGRQNAFRALCVAVTSAIAILIPQFGLVSNTVGAFSCEQPINAPANIHVITTHQYSPLLVRLV